MSDTSNPPAFPKIHARIILQCPSDPKETAAGQVQGSMKDPELMRWIPVKLAQDANLRDVWSSVKKSLIYPKWEEQNTLIIPEDIWEITVSWAEGSPAENSIRGENFNLKGDIKIWTTDIIQKWGASFRQGKTLLPIITIYFRSKWDIDQDIAQQAAEVQREFAREFTSITSRF